MKNILFERIIKWKEKGGFGFFIEEKYNSNFYWSKNYLKYEKSK